MGLQRSSLAERFAQALGCSLWVVPNRTCSPGEGSAAVGLCKSHSSGTTAAKGHYPFQQETEENKWFLSYMWIYSMLGYYFPPLLRAIRECAYEIPSAFTVHCPTGCFYCPSLLWIAHLYLYKSLDFTPFPMPGMGRCFSAAEILSAGFRAPLPNAFLYFSKWNEHLKTLLFTA